MMPKNEYNPFCNTGNDIDDKLRNVAGVLWGRDLGIEQAHTFFDRELTKQERFIINEIMADMDRYYASKFGLEIDEPETIH